MTAVLVIAAALAFAVPYLGACRRSARECREQLQIVRRLTRGG